MASPELLSAVRTVLCKGLSVEQAQELIGATMPVRATSGSVIFREGDRSAGLLVLVRGTAEIVKQGHNGGELVIAAVSGPTVLGEMGLILDRPHSATVRARGDCECYLLTKAQFQRLLEKENLAAYKLVGSIAEVLAHRLDLMDRKVVELAEHQNSSAPPVEELAAFKQKLFAEWSF